MTRFQRRCLALGFVCLGVFVQSAAFAGDDVAVTLSAQRVTVISERLKALPSPPARPRSMTRPVSGPRRRVWAGRAGAAFNRARMASPLAFASTAIQRWRA